MKCMNNEKKMFSLQLQKKIIFILLKSLYKYM